MTGAAAAAVFTNSTGPAKQATCFPSLSETVTCRLNLPAGALAGTG